MNFPSHPTDIRQMEEKRNKFNELLSSNHTRIPHHNKFHRNSIKLSLKFHSFLMEEYSSIYPEWIQNLLKWSLKVSLLWLTNAININTRLLLQQHSINSSLHHFVIESFHHLIIDSFIECMKQSLGLFIYIWMIPLIPLPYFVTSYITLPYFNYLPIKFYLL